MNKWIFAGLLTMACVEVQAQTQADLRILLTAGSASIMEVAIPNLKDR